METNAKCPHRSPLTAHRSPPIMVSGFLAGFVFLLGSFSGCRPSTASITDSRNSTVAPVSESATTKLEKDLGVIFIDEASYVAFPLADLGLDSDGEIANLSSSCECVVPSVCDVQKSSRLTDRVLRLDFRIETQPSEIEAFHPQNLGVIINVQYASGAKQSVTFLMLHTIRSVPNRTNAGGGS
jgi:hypothetical protein